MKIDAKTLAAVLECIEKDKTFDRVRAEVKRAVELSNKKVTLEEALRQVELFAKRV